MPGPTTFRSNLFGCRSPWNGARPSNPRPSASAPSGSGPRTAPGEAPWGRAAHYLMITVESSRCPGSWPSVDRGRRSGSANSKLQGGFTLIEVLIAAVLLAVMMSLLLSAFRVAASTWEKGERKAEQVNRMLVVTNFLRSYVGGAVPVMEPPNTKLAGARPRALFRGDAEHLLFVASIPAQAKGGFYQFQLYISGDEHHDLRASIRPLPQLKADAPEPEPIDDVAVVENVESVRFSYFNSDPQGRMETQPRTEWPPQDMGDGTPPRPMPTLVRIEIQPSGEDPWPLISIEPRVDALR
ncbi:MAG: prepilin-type N-terminal cleavage/methylation domain-containing protein [Methylococcaceae bacterium]|nr:prepilin-type N-terminal cleavage/methylation domain-containing protein [Methylococcaceae bacterium]